MSKLHSFVAVSDTAENPKSGARIIARVHATSLEHAGQKFLALHNGLPAEAKRFLSWDRWQCEMVSGWSGMPLTRREASAMLSLTRKTDSTLFGF